MMTEELLALEHIKAAGSPTTCSWHGHLWVCGRDPLDSSRSPNNGSKILTRLRRAAPEEHGKAEGSPTNSQSNRSKLLTRLRRSAPEEAEVVEYVVLEPGKSYKPIML